MEDLLAWHIYITDNNQLLTILNQKFEPAQDGLVLTSLSNCEGYGGLYR